YLGIVLVVGGMWAVRGQRPRRLTAAGSAAALAGLVLVLDLSGGGPVQPVGFLWGLGAAVGLAGYFIVSARTDTGLPPVVLASAGMAVGTLVLVVVGLVGPHPLRATFGDVVLGDHRTSWLVPVAGLSLVAAVVAYVSGIAAARILDARLASFVGLTEVLFAILIAWWVLAELPTAVQLAGGALIVVGVALVRLDELRPGPAGSGRRGGRWGRPGPPAREPAARGAPDRPRSRRWSLIQSAADDLLLDLCGAAVDRLHRAVQPRLRARVLQHVAVAAVQLHAPVGDLVLQLGGPPLAHRGVDRAQPARVQLADAVVDEGTRDGDLCGQLGRSDEHTPE